MDSYLLFHNNDFSWYFFDLFQTCNLRNKVIIIYNAFLLRAVPGYWIPMSISYWIPMLKECSIIFVVSLFLVLNVIGPVLKNICTKLNTHTCFACTITVFTCTVTLNGVDSLLMLYSLLAEKFSRILLLLQTKNEMKTKTNEKINMIFFILFY